MNGRRLSERLICSLLHAARGHGRIHNIQRLRFDNISLRKMNGVMFTTYQRLLKQTDGTESGSSSSDSSDSSGSDSDSDGLKERTELPGNKTNTGNILNILSQKKSLGTKSSTDEIVADSTSANSDTQSSTLLNLLKKTAEKRPANAVESLKKVLNESTSANSDTQSSTLLNLLKKTAEKRPANAVESLKKVLNESVNTELVSEAQKLSKIIPGHSKETESALLGQLLNQFDTTARQKTKDLRDRSEQVPKSFSELMEGIPAKKRTDKEKKWDNNNMHYDEQEHRGLFRMPGNGLFNGKPLGIFTKEYMEHAKTDKKSLFEVVAEEEKNLSEKYPVENAFDEHIQWTKEGKLWTFPLDNEAGWEEEKNTSFQQHVFLERELVGFPRKGPVRHFMELVTVALSKNPYLTYVQKCEHIQWYRNYFVEKQEMLEERLGVDGVVQPRQS